MPCIFRRAFLIQRRASAGLATVPSQRLGLRASETVGRKLLGEPGRRSVRTRRISVVLRETLALSVVLDRLTALGASAGWWRAPRLSDATNRGIYWGGAAVARQAHNLEIAGSIPAPSIRYGGHLLALRSAVSLLAVGIGAGRT